MMERAARERWKVFLLGGKPGVAARTARHLCEHYPGVRLDVHQGAFAWGVDAPEGDAALDRINNFNPDLLLVGMGMPKQETWLLDHEVRLKARAMMSVGALMDYVVATFLPNSLDREARARMGVSPDHDFETRRLALSGRTLVLLPLLVRDLMRRPRA